MSSRSFLVGGTDRRGRSTFLMLTAHEKIVENLLRDIKILFSLCCFFLTLVPFFCQSTTAKSFVFPDIDGYQTLLCDFHMHTVFSDGLVWPTTRVKEAFLEGLDAIAITDHDKLTHSPFRMLVGYTNLNKSYKITKRKASKRDIIVIPGIELTRDLPYGHFNVLFVKDANLLKNLKVEVALKAAYEQGAFIMWNHPCWKLTKTNLDSFPVHLDLYLRGYIHGIEIINSRKFCPEAWLWTKDKNLTIFANSDIHFPRHSTFFLKHRPITLVFSKTRSAEGIKEALFSHRTIAFYQQQLYGDKALLEKLLEKTILYNILSISPEDKTIIEMKNLSSANIVLELVDTTWSNQNPMIKKVVIPPLSTVLLEFSMKNFLEEKMSFWVRTFFYDVEKNIVFDLLLK